LGRIEQVMDASSLRTLIEDVAEGRCTPDDAVLQLRRLPYSDLGFARWTTTATCVWACRGCLRTREDA